ncbi:class I SAM-dependent rRNA methyltransferase [Rhabdobacter roseus]|uniref:23S rRNA (Cytosine1962-C5)-methyltransferase n=1 Tax=Rhabdobacter roseus TaxID=1655419 RepID=A0A840TU77_9BACT|nr:class I SAM-dependent rRNA methyltransferase [Rhabdobacter roseus]MBB5283550.1 23S rRNA (cytosine1962-C5)-methyltransferase [Rhabdobacter roseus]
MTIPTKEKVPGLPRIILQKGKDEAIRRMHPWVFSGAIARVEGEVSDGDLVEVLTSKNQFLAQGHYHDGSIKVRLFSYEPGPIGVEFWEERLRNAYELRQQLQLPQTDCYRLIHGEGDGLPGLVIDVYGRVAVLQAHTIGMHRVRQELTEALRRVLGTQLECVYDKSRETLPADYAATIKNEYLHGHVQVPYRVSEYGKYFEVDWELGQKTGFFLDQRENRQLLAHYAPGKTVLNAFSYSGGFSVYALTAGATQVDSIDVSGKATVLCENNVALNEGTSRHRALTEDVMKWLRVEETTYDIVVLDPPAFAKSRSARHRAVQGYKRLNAEGLLRVKPGGLLFTFSCSQVVERELFYNTIVAAAMEAGRRVRVIHQLTQGPDHPVNIFHPEGSYLKGLVLRVE